MKAYWAPIIFAAGLGAGLLIFGGDFRESAEAAENKSAVPVVHKREVRPATTPHEAKFRSFAKEFPKLSNEDKETFKKSLAPGDRAAAIEALLAQSGPEGISWDAKSMIGGILSTWAGEDFKGVWAWCQRIESNGNRNFLVSKLIEGLMNKDPDRALALHVEMATEDPDFSSCVPLDILRKAATQDAASFLDLLGKLPFRNGSSGTAMNFAADFDFQQAADGLVALEKKNSDVMKSSPVYATNFLSSWAARDAEAAYAWFSKNPGAANFEYFGNLLDGIEMQGVPGASYAWAADKLIEPGPARDAILRSLTQGSSDRRRTVINSIAQAMPDTTSRELFLVGLVTTNNSWSEPAVEFSYALTQMSTPAARLEALRQLGTNGRLCAANIPDAQLQQWGLTRQQVEQAEASGR